MNKINFKLTLLFAAFSISVFAFNRSTESNPEYNFDYALGENCNSRILNSVPYKQEIIKNYKGKTNPEWGTIFAWGTSAKDAYWKWQYVTHSYIRELSRKGVKEEDVRYWWGVYDRAVEKGAGGQVAVERRELMKRILKWY